MAASKAKQYLRIHDKTLLEHTLQIFLKQKYVGPIVVVLHPDDHIFAGLAIASHANIHAVIGGRERVDSVLAGLRYLLTLGHANNFTLVHDAARPCLEAKDLNNLIQECLSASTNNTVVAGAILACPVVDTIKKSHRPFTKQHRPTAQNNSVSDDASESKNIEQALNIVENTIERSALWHAQTPQMFKVDELAKAIETGLSKGLTLTDEASAIESTGKQVLLVEGSSSNLKITRPSDLPLASFYLSRNKITTTI